MSPRAAWRLESFGYGPVYDYVTGKADWRAAGLPTVRSEESRREQRALDAADRSPPTCSPGTPVADLTADTSTIVVNEAGVVVGYVPPAAEREGDGSGGAAAAAGDVMRPGPTTVRADEALEPLLHRMHEKGVDEVIVTTPEGVLLGVVRH